MTHTPAPAFARSSGPRDAKIVLVGEAFGREEDLVKRPFIGASGQELTLMLRDAGIERGSCFLTNVFAFRPENNDIKTLCAKKSELPSSYALPPVGQGQYIRPEFLGEIDRLQDELLTVHPNVVVALGNIACWALFGSVGISNLRGAMAYSTLCPSIKGLATYHPAGVLRNWSWRPIVLADLKKAAHEAQKPGLDFSSRTLVVSPFLDELGAWCAAAGGHFADPTALIAVDIETSCGAIDMCGVAISPTNAACFPFFDKTSGEPFWSLWDEIKVRQMLQSILASPCRKVLQNGLYDIQYLRREGFALRNFTDDTMMLHHSLFPELPKGLGFLGSIYCNERSWKLLNRQKELKKDA